MAVPRALILSVVAVAVICSVFSVTDAKVCGGDHDCLVPQAHGRCVSGTCKYLCYSNYKDCDHDMSNGCECDVLTHGHHCGGCNRMCPAPYNAVATCEAGRCVIRAGSDQWGGKF